MLGILGSILFKQELKTGQVKLQVFAYKVGQPSQLIVMNQKARNTYKEMTIFIFGPFKETTLKDWR